MEPQQQKDAPLFVDGYFTNDIPDTAPAFILGKGSFHVKKLVAFIQANEKYATNGWINFVTKRSKNGTRYTEVDIYSWKKAQEKKDEQKAEIDPNAPVINPETGEEIPFN